MARKRNGKTEKLLEEMAGLKKEQSQTEERIKEIQKEVLSKENPPDELETEHGKLKLINQTRQEVKNNMGIRNCLKRMNYTESDMAEMYKFQAGQLKKKVGEDKVKKWVEDGYITESSYSYYQLQKKKK